MSETKGYIAKLEVDVVLLHGSFVDNVAFTVTDIDESPHDFSGSTGYELIIWNKRAKSNKELATIVSAGGDLTETGGVIWWNADFPAGVGFGEWPYDLNHIDAEGTKRVAEGILIVQ